MPYRITKTSILLLAILVLALVVRVYRTDQLLGFYYDQGRDAKIIWDLWHAGKFFLIGPTTGIEGIFRGPWYYWLIAPWYLVGQGNPVWPAVFLAATTVLAIWWGYRLAVQAGGSKAGLIFAFLAGLSFYLGMDSRWLSNPTPMFIISMAYVQTIFWVLDGKRWGWLGIGLVWGMAMQFGSATEIFYLVPVLALIWHTRRMLAPRWMVIGAVLALLAFVPQIIFDLRHQGILRDNIYKFLITQNSFRLGFWETVKVRLPFYADVFWTKIFPVRGMWWVVGSLSLIATPLTRKAGYVWLLWLGAMVGMLFFQGNQGNVFGYYFTGYYLIFVLLVAISLGRIAAGTWGRVVVGIILAAFAWQNVPRTIGYITSGVDGETTIALGNQMQAVNWIYQDAQGEEFNVDVYVPPVIPHAYDYLFLWLGSSRYHRQPEAEQVPRLYTLYEVDPPHPERLERWLARQGGIASILDRIQFGGITVERRQR